jgi:hypothetical protein
VSPRRRYIRRLRTAEEDGSAVAGSAEARSDTAPFYAAGIARRDKPFAVRMFGRMDVARRSRGVRLAMLLAACLSSASAFGLHPEPSGGRVADKVASLELPGARLADSSPHACIACRVHRPLVFASTPASIPNQRLSLGETVPALLSPTTSFEPATFDSRAPPLPSST